MTNLLEFRLEGADFFSFNLFSDYDQESLLSFYFLVVGGYASPNPREIFGSLFYPGCCWDMVFV